MKGIFDSDQHPLQNLEDECFQTPLILLVFLHLLCKPFLVEKENGSREFHDALGLAAAPSSRLGPFEMLLEIRNIMFKLGLSSNGYVAALLAVWGL